MAEIVAAAQVLIEDRAIRHGTVKLLFTTDEEIGRGVDKVDLKKLGADFAYTMDGSTAGSIEAETFSADRVDIAITGVAIHPGFAKDKMENAIKIAAAIVDRLPKDAAPETTEGRQGFVHPTDISGAHGEGGDQPDRARFRGCRARRKGGDARGDRQGRAEGLSRLLLPLQGDASSTAT